MTINEFIDELERLDDIAVWELADTLTDYARDRIHLALTEAIDKARENYAPESLND